MVAGGFLLHTVRKLLTRTCHLIDQFLRSVRGREEVLFINWCLFVAGKQTHCTGRVSLAKSDAKELKLPGKSYFRIDTKLLSLSIRHVFLLDGRGLRDTLKRTFLKRR